MPVPINLPTSKAATQKTPHRKTPELTHGADRAPGIRSQSLGHLPKAGNKYTTLKTDSYQRVYHLFRVLRHQREDYYYWLFRVSDEWYRLERCANEGVERQASQSGEDYGGEALDIAEAPRHPLDRPRERVGALETGIDGPAIEVAGKSPPRSPGPSW